MKKWSISFLLVLLACIPIFTHRGTGPELLQDTDTSVLLQTVRARHAPLSWFAGDWPLQNHFYRPLPTLTFELDNYLYGNHAAGYGTTNAILAIACVLLLFWFLREITDSPGLTTLSTCLFALWTGGSFANFSATCITYFSYAALALAIFLLLRYMNQKPFPWARVRLSLAAFLTLYYAAVEVRGQAVTPIGELPQRMIQWLPGRTASVMTLFALLAMAAYARYERTSAEEIPSPPTPLDHPATRSTQQTSEAKNSWIWGVVAIVGAALAFASYEQAVMLPAALLGVAVAMRMQRYKVRWVWQIPFWLLLIGYMVLRKELLPPGTSGYQKQQLRFGPGVGLSLWSYALPFFLLFVQSVETLSNGIILLVTPDIYIGAFLFLANLTAFYQARKKLVFALTGWALSLLTFLPMAWVKPFEHYDFWPMAMRSLFAVTLCWVGYDVFASAASLPAVQAPPRLDPAPGSLPRP